MDSFRLDSHKLMYHVARVSQWIEGKKIFPIYVELGLYGGCNHRCIFCAFDYLKYKPHMSSEACVKEFLLEAARNGVKAVLFSGEGEPLLHPQAAELIVFAHSQKVDTALSTNGVFLTHSILRKILPRLSWLRVSLNAGSGKSYALIHGTSENDFQSVLHNLKDAVRMKKKNKYDCTIGVQCVLLPYNIKELPKLADMVKQIGADYLVIKPFSLHPLSLNNVRTDIYKEVPALQNKLRKYSNKNFQVIFRKHSFNKIKTPKPYKKCLGFAFVSHVMAGGGVFPCNAFLGKKGYLLGNIAKNSFSDILKNDRTSAVIHKIHRNWDVNKCTDACRLDEINCYLWDLKHRVRHHNFI